MSTVKISGNASGSGSLTIAAPNTNSDLTLNLPTTLGSNNGSAVVTTDAAGNLGLGVTPSAWYSTYRVLEGASASLYFRTDTVNDSGFMANAYRDASAVYRFKQNGAATYYQQGSGAHQFFTSGSSGTAGNAISFTQAMTLDASGNLLVGTTGNASGAKLKLQTAASGIPIHATDGTNGDFFVDFPSTSVTRLTAEYGSGGVMVFANGNTKTERARIDASGNLLVGTTSQANGCKVSLQYGGTVSWGLGPSSGSNTFYVTNNSGTGVYLSTGSTSWAATSDERTKDIIEPITNAAEKVASLRAVIGKYKTDEEGVRRAFLIAQDVQAVLPEAISVQEDELGTLGVQYTDTIPLLVAAIKELKADLDATKAELAALKGAQA